MDSAHFFEMLFQRIDGGLWEHCRAVRVAFPATHDKLRNRKVDVLHPHLRAVQHAKPEDIQQGCRNPVFSIQQAEHLPDFLERTHHRKAARANRALHGIKLRHPKLQDFAVRKQQRIQGLILRRGRYFAVNIQTGRKCLDLDLAEFTRMATVVEQHNLANPPPNDVQQHRLVRHDPVSAFLPVISIPVSRAAMRVIQSAARMQTRIHDRIAETLSDTCKVYL